MSSTTITISCTSELLERIDKAAEREGKSRSAYIVQWLPENYDDTASTTSPSGIRNAVNGRR